MSAVTDRPILPKTKNGIKNNNNNNSNNNNNNIRIYKAP